MAVALDPMVNFDNMTSEEKQKKVIAMILQMTNFTDLSPTLDWLIPSIRLHVPSIMVLSVLRSIDYERILRELVGEKTIPEIMTIIFNFKE